MVNCNAIGCNLEPIAQGFWLYHTTHGRIDILTDGYFNGLRTTLRPGDFIGVPFINGAIMGAGLYMVDRADNNPDENHIAVTLWEIIHFDRSVSPPVAMTADEVPSPAQYVPEDCEIKWNVGRRAHDVVGSKSGKIYAFFKDKAHAQAVARGDKPLTADETEK